MPIIFRNFYRPVKYPVYIILRKFHQKFIIYPRIYNTLNFIVRNSGTAYNNLIPYTYNTPNFYYPTYKYQKIYLIYKILNFHYLKSRIYNPPHFYLQNSSLKHTLTTINNNYLEIGIFHIIIVLEKLNNMEVYNKMVEYCKKLDDDTFAKAIDIFSKNHSLMCPIFEDDFNDFKKIVIKCKLQEIIDLLWLGHWRIGRFLGL